MNMRSEKRSAISHPIARDEGLLVETIADETVIYDLESKQAHCLKALPAVVFAQADGRRSVTDIAELAGYRLGRAVSEAEVEDALAQLAERALLNGPPLVVHNGVSRREALGTFAAAGAGTVLITSVMAPIAMATSSCCSGCSGTQGSNTCFSGATPSGDYAGCKPCTSSGGCASSGYLCCCIPCDAGSYGNCCQSVCVLAGSNKTCSAVKSGYRDIVTGTSCPASYCLSYCKNGFDYKCCETSENQCCSNGH